MSSASLTQELGFLKYSYFKSTTLFKPAVTIMVFDWQNHTGSNETSGIGVSG